MPKEPGPEDVEHVPAQMIGLAAVIGALIGSMRVAGLLSEEEIDEVLLVAEDVAADSGGGREAARAIETVRTISASITATTGDNGG